MPAAPTITLLTDFGTRDVYAGVMRGVIAGIAPAARVVDLTHEVAPQAVDEAGFLLAQAAPFFPAGTIHVAVVDPGVGTARKVVCARSSRAVYLAPDNGLLSRALEQDPPDEVRSVEERRWFLPALSSTFHGRDLFAPVAAHLANGVAPRELGPPLERLAGPALERPRRSAGRVVGRVVHVDRFGNLVTDIPTAGLGPIRSAVVAGREVAGPLARTYGERPAGSLVLLAGSSQTLEVSVVMGSAAELTGAGPGVEIVVSEDGP